MYPQIFFSSRLIFPSSGPNLYFCFFVFNLFIIIIYFWLCWVFVSVRGLSLVAVRGPLTIAASLVAEHRLQTRRLSNCGSRAQLLCGVWDLPRPGLEPVSPALAGRFSTTVPPGKPPNLLFNQSTKFLDFYLLFPDFYLIF